MKIVSVKVSSTRIPTFRNHKMNIGITSRQENVIVRITTDTGIVGYGEAAFMLGHSVYGETPATVRAVLKEKLIPCILGRDPLKITALWEAIHKTVPANMRTKNSIIVACYDIAGKALNTPVYNLLGGKYRDGIPLSWSLPIEDYDMIINEAKSVIDRGWRILKIKGGRMDPLDDVEALRRVRKAVGPDIHIRVDANQAYDVHTAIKVINGMSEWGLEYMEQPCAMWDLDGHAYIRKATNFPIMLDESLKQYSVREIIERSAADYLSIYVYDPGGILNARKISVVAEEFHMKGYIGGALESVIGTSAGLHIAASSPSISLGCEMTGQYMLEKDIGVKPLEMKNGCLMVPDGPGLGIELDEDVISHYEEGETETFNI